jgi:tRNA-(ms[2]io[6]A)-hydroxylase
MLKSTTASGWYAAASASLPPLVRRYASDPEMVTSLVRLAHEETSHVVQVSELLARLGHRPAADRANLYARALLAEVRPREPHRQLDLLLVAALIEARSHERLNLLSQGFARDGQDELAHFYRALSAAEDRHAEIYRQLATRVVSEDEVEARLGELATREAGILASLPMEPRIH